MDIVFYEGASLVGVTKGKNSKKKKKTTLALHRTYIETPGQCLSDACHGRVGMAVHGTALAPFHYAL